jgi:hypothetical protein
MNKTANVQNTKSNEGIDHLNGINWSFVLQGALTVLAVLVMVAFWGTFAYSMWSGNVKLAMAFGQIIAAMVGVAVPIMIILKLREFLTK